MPAEVTGEQDDDSGETGDGEADDEEGAGEEDDEVSHEVGGADSSSERAQSASMSSRSESKPYSSITHKCEVRNISLVQERRIMLLSTNRVFLPVFRGY